MKRILILTVALLGFSSAAFADIFVCNAQSYTEKFNEKDSELAKNIAGFFSSNVDHWLRTHSVNSYTVEEFDISVKPNPPVNFESATLDIVARILTEKGSTLNFNLHTDNLLVQQGNDPLDSSISTCGPMSGLKPSFHIIVTDENSRQIDKMFVSVWGQDISYRYKIAP